MKLFAVLGIFAAGYAYVLTSTTDMVIAQTQELHSTYQAAAKEAEQLAGDQ